MVKKIPIMVEVGKRIRALREKVGLSQETFALKCGFDRSYYGALERGEKNISVVRLHEIAAALRVDIVDLLRSKGRR